MSVDVVFRLDQQQLDLLLLGSEGAVAKHLQNVGRRVANNAKRRCPVDTGRLRSSITHAVFREGDHLSAHVGTDVEYAIYVELGTSRMRAQPFLRPALAEEAAKR